MSKVRQFEEMPQRLLRSVSSSTGVDFGTTEPYAVGRIGFSSIGFADIPVVGCRVNCREIESVIPVIRQRVFRAVSDAGLSTANIALRPSVGRESRKRRFRDENPASKSHGKAKISNVWRVSFELLTGSDRREFESKLGKVYL